MEPIFHPDPYGYRPWCGALDALARCGQRCQKNWMLDLDVQKFADSVDHDLMVKAVQANVTPAQRWVVLYVKRWLKAPLALPDGTLQARDPGNTSGFCGLTRARQPVPALRVRLLAGPYDPKDHQPPLEPAPTRRDNRTARHTGHQNSRSKPIQPNRQARTSHR